MLHLLIYYAKHSHVSIGSGLDPWNIYGFERLYHFGVAAEGHSDFARPTPSWREFNRTSIIVLNKRRLSPQGCLLRSATR